MINHPNRSKSRYQVRSFGRDCLGNVSGYCVVDTARVSQLNDGIIQRFVADLYIEGSHKKASDDARALADKFNGFKVEV